RVLTRRETVGDPLSIRRPIEPGNLRPLALVEHATLLRLQIHVHEFIAMVRQRDRFRFWRHSQIDHATNAEALESMRRGRAIAVVDFERLLAVGIADEDEPLAVVEPAWKAITDAVRLAVLQHRPLPVAHREAFAPSRQRQQMSLRMRRVALEILAGVNELAIALRARAVVVDLDLRSRVAGR